MGAASLEICCASCNVSLLHLSSELSALTVRSAPEYEAPIFHITFPLRTFGQGCQGLWIQSMSSPTNWSFPIIYPKQKGVWSVQGG